jgi:hypothetical protein
MPIFVHLSLNEPLLEANIDILAKNTQQEYMEHAIWLLGLSMSVYPPDFCINCYLVLPVKTERRKGALATTPPV